VAVHDTSLSGIDEAFQRMIKLFQLQERTNFQQDLQRQQSLLALRPASPREIAHLPFNNIPPTTNFYDRIGITGRLEEFFYPPSGEAAFRSIVLYGIGGVGKSSIALKYSNMKAKSHSVDAILWFHVKTKVSLSQSFTEAAIALGFERVGRDRPDENRIILLNWLQQTGRKRFEAAAFPVKSSPFRSS
jgi:hypothetical protein